MSATADALKTHSFRVFPNPSTSGYLMVEMKFDRMGKIGFNLTDLTGKIVYTFPILDKTNNKQVGSLNTAGIPAGVYFLTARLEGEVLTSEMIILH
ncbi:MAG: T9SS type A sorting domain-containing protein [Saprospiraceae bacterium]|nr:T9SS type A sorting domain-containing protein [Saprospiraceae bacterium]